MRAWKVCAALLLAAATAFYALTAIVYEGAGVGASLVLKPRPQWMLAAGGEPERSSGAPEPWWRSDDLLVLIDGHHDGPGSVWSTIYGAGYLVTSVGWISALCWLVAWAFGSPTIERTRRTAHSPPKRRE